MSSRQAHTVRVRVLVVEDHVALANRIGEGLRDAALAGLVLRRLLVEVFVGRVKGEPAGHSDPAGGGLRVRVIRHPAARMHWEYFNPVASICCCFALVSGLPFGSRCWQALLAEEYSGELAGLACPLPPMSNPPLLAGSGKFPTPWARMHLA